MAQRTVALCDGKYIGIESIYTVVGGKQINLPEKLAVLRQKSRNNKLFCPCGCGSNLVLVASENNLREQHFRLKIGEFNKECQAVTEGKRSVESKIILKCWLDDKLKDSEIESRVPISDVSDTDRRYEFTFLSRTNSVGISYCHDRVNISDQKLNLLADNSAGINLVHILDACNFTAEGQYPEAEMKIQNIQGYCLLLDIDDKLNYYDAKLSAVFYAQNFYGLWKEIEICADALSEFSFTNGVICYKGRPVQELAKADRKSYDENLQRIKLQHEEAKRKQEAYEKEQRELAEKRRQELQKQREEEARKRAEQYEKQLAEEARREAERLERQRLLEEQRKEAERLADLAEKKDIEARLTQQKEQVIDSHGKRWIKCEFCGLIANVSSFSSYGGDNHVNLGTCKECRTKNAVSEELFLTDVPKKTTMPNPSVCPECGGRIIERMGIYGPFKSCSNYPRCRYKPRKW